MILEKETFDSVGKGFDKASVKANIICQCDYCGIIFSRMKHNIIRSWKHIKSDSCNNAICVQKKRVQTNRKLFGTDNAFQNEDVKTKIKETNIEIYGVSNPTQNKEIREKQIETCKKIYGVENIFQNEDVKKDIKKKIKDKFGVDNVFQNADVQKKQKETMAREYGVHHALQKEEFRQKAMETCIENHGHFPANNYGKMQKEIQEWLNSFGFNFKSSRSLMPGFEIDLYDETKKIAIEYCGLHWHHEFSLEPRKNNYHWNKHKACLDKGVQLLTIFSDEWLTKLPQCQSHIKALLGVVEKKIYARKCIVKNIDAKEGRAFFAKYHIQGKNNLGIVFFGIYHEEELCGVISLGRHSRQYTSIVLDRLCFKAGVQILGGASKLFSRCVEWAKNNDHKEIISFSDNRWSVGKVYESLKFSLDKEYRPDYSYVKIDKATERISKQSQKKQTVNCPEGLTEFQWAHERGLARIWDCGKKRWIFKILEGVCDVGE